MLLYVKEDLIINTDSIVFISVVKHDDIYWADLYLGDKYWLLDKNEYTRLIYMLENEGVIK